MSKLIRILFLFIFLPLFAFSQLTKIRGVVTDAANGEPIPFANVYLVGTTVGTTTDFDGRFYFETRTEADSLAATYVGYRRQAMPIRQNQYQEIIISLVADQINLQEVVIVAGENPADILLRKIIANKDKNDNRELIAWQCEVYNKIQFDANNFGEKIRKRKLFKPFEFIFDYVDTSTVNGKAYLPIFISEAVSDMYFRSAPKTKIEKIKAAKGSGIENPSLAQFMGNLYQEVNIYDNYIELFSKNFVSPIANFGMSYYQYYLVDSAFIDNQWCYKLMYKPKREQELTFTGSMWIHDTTYAVRKVEMDLASDANLNYVADASLRQEYKQIGNIWMLSRDYIIADFNILNNTDSKLPGFFGQRTSVYSDYVLNQPKEDDFYRSPVNVIVEEGSMDMTDSYWETARPEQLTKKEIGIYHMIDSVERVPMFRTYTDFIYMGAFGYLPWNKFEIGPLAKIYSYNEVEGNRFRIGGRTSTLFSDNLRLEGHLAYGHKDMRVKYGAGLLYVINKNPRRAVGLNFKYDIEQLGASFNAFSEDNIISTLFRRQPADKLNLVSEFGFYYEHEWFTGYSNRLFLKHRELFPAGNFVMETFDDEGALVKHSSLITTEIGIDFRYAHREKYVVRDFDRINLGTRYPIFNLRYTYGAPGVINGEYEYHRLQGSVTQWFNVGSFGWSKYIIEGGQVFGTLPFPLLVLHPGNETFIFDEYAFNLMNYYEFISDRYLSIYYTHHFDGFLFNKIPLFRKLKWREVVFAKGLVGTITDANLQLNKLPDVTYMLDKPYFEAGVGVENIFKILRIDGVWRLSHRDNQHASNFALFMSLHFDF
ncbi:MAG: DUF5686 and carboxypeptidase regulatory-like domain-containing protein [Bacteroidetes bacterium]|nr:DUF5686 and carboxypeptidase regulatory-like domain-containing protein [Bacteroidota bacterium]